MTEAKKNNSKKVVFIVEDDAFLLKAYRVKFEQEGAEVWEAADGKSAISFLEKNPPNIVLLDLMLPGLSGFEVLETIRKHPRWKNVPVIILSNLGQEQDIEQGKKLGIADYIIKADVKISDVISKVKKYL